MRREAGGPRAARLLLFSAALLAPAARGEGPAPGREAALSRARELRLWEEPGWAALLHYKPGLFGSPRSDASAGLFASPEGPADPRAELEASVSGLFEEPPKPDAALACRFPARAAWLRERLGEAAPPAASCPEYEAWRALLDARGASLVFASAYMNNPSSMFGHTFLRLERSRPGESQRLLDNTLNFAAETGGDNALFFAFKGLAGLYPGKYTLMPYYMKVQEYGNIENRDLWEYRLALTSAQVDRLAAHVWEMGKGTFPYYFFSRNCSYQLLPALEAAVAGLSLAPRPPPLAAPMDAVRLLRAAGLAGEPAYRPSHATTMRQRRARLSPAERSAARAYSLGLYEEGDRRSAGWPDSRRALVLDAAQDFVLYRAGFSPDVPAEVRRLEQGLLLRRAKVPGPSFEPPRPRWAAPPEEGHPRRRLLLGGGRAGGEGFLELGWRPGYHELLDPARGFASGASIESFSWRLRGEPASGRAYLQDLRVVEILSAAPLDPWAPKPAWSAGLGLEAVPERDPRGPAAFEGHAGSGAAAEPAEGLLAFALLQAEGAAGGVFRGGGRLGGGLRAGAAAERGAWRAAAEAGWSGYAAGDAAPLSRLRLSLQRAFSRDAALRAQAAWRGRRAESGLSIVLYH